MRVVGFDLVGRLCLTRSGYQRYTGRTEDGKKVWIGCEHVVAHGSYKPGQRQKRQQIWRVKVDGQEIGTKGTYAEARAFAEEELGLADAASAEAESTSALTPALDSAGAPIIDALRAPTVVRIVGRKDKGAGQLGEVALPGALDEHLPRTLAQVAPAVQVPGVDPTAALIPEPFGRDVLDDFVRMTGEALDCENWRDLKADAPVGAAAEAFRAALESVLTYWVRSPAGAPYADDLVHRMDDACYYTFASLQGWGVGLWSAWDDVLPKPVLLDLQNRLRKHPGMRQTERLLESAVTDAAFADCEDADDDGEAGGGSGEDPPAVRRPIRPEERPRMQALRIVGK